jgi:hypothetical protein
VIAATSAQAWRPFPLWASSRDRTLGFPRPHRVRARDGHRRINALARGGRPDASLPFYEQATSQAAPAEDAVPFNDPHDWQHDHSGSEQVNITKPQMREGKAQVLTAGSTAVSLTDYNRA